MEKQELAVISRFARRELKEEEIYTFPVVLCDNEIDRDGERFTSEALAELAKLFVGKTGIFDHNPSGKNQTARIYRAQVETDPAKTTRAGEPYRFLKAWAYMLKTEGTAQLIAEIDGGIKKEVSVSCQVAEVRCSICGKPVPGCRHEKGGEYGGKRCHHVLDKPVDAYEWSFVAVPAQIGAGVTKGFLRDRSDGPRDLDTLLKAFAAPGEELRLSRQEALLLGGQLSRWKEEAALGAAWREDLRRDVCRLAFLAGDPVDAEILESVVSKMEIAELKEFQRAYQLRTQNDPPVSQLGTVPAREEALDLTGFKL